MVIATHCNLRPPDVVLVVIHHNYETHEKMEVPNYPFLTYNAFTADNLRYRTPVIQLYQSYNNHPISKLHKFQLLCLVIKYFNCNEKLRIIFSNFITPNSKIDTHSTRCTNDLHLSLAAPQPYDLAKKFN